MRGATLDTDAVLAEELFDAIGQLRRQSRRNAGGPWPAQQLSGAQVELVRLVHRQPGISIAESAAELGVAPNTVSTLVREMVDAGLLVRKADSVDRRVARLELTPVARRQVEQWRDRRIALAAQAITRLSPEDRTALERAIPVISELAVSLRPPVAEATRD
jgi:DNA-binding MarR family transcriptional regulator